MTQRILLIDDDELLCEVLAGFLEMTGYEVVQAGNGREGLEQLRAGVFDLIVLDLLMPEMDGIRFLRSRPGEAAGGAAVPVLVISASATADVVDTLDFPGVVGVVRKPIQPPILLERIAAILGPGGTR